MQRVVFLLEAEAKQISCMLNPETIVIYRQAGYREKQSIGGGVSNAIHSESPLLFTGGGSTFIELELLFDTTLADVDKTITDVRQLTSKFFMLTEAVTEGTGVNQLPVIRMIWGKSWNTSAVVTDVVERLDYFTRNGVPRRSWLKMRLRKVNPERSNGTAIVHKKKRLSERILKNVEELKDKFDLLESKGKTMDTQTLVTTDPLDSIAQKYYQDSSLWKLLAVFNNIGQPTDVSSQRRIKVPSLAELNKMISM